MLRSAVLCSMLYALVACGGADPATESGEPSHPSTDCSDTFSLRVVYDVENSFKRDALARVGAPTAAKDIERTEVLIRSTERLVRRTGNAWGPDPEQFDLWEAEYEAIAALESSQQALDRALEWKARGEQIPNVLLPIEWVDFRADPGRMSYRYGIDPRAPQVGERYLEDGRPLSMRRIATGTWGAEIELLAEDMAGVTKRNTSVAGIECVMLSLQTANRERQTCVAIVRETPVLLMALDRSAEGTKRFAVTSIDSTSCITDAQLAPPGRINWVDD